MDAAKQILAVGAGGFLGALCRHGVTVLGIRLGGIGFPYGTVTANLLGCLAIGYLAGRIATTSTPDGALRLFLMTGLLGGFTTFSTFGLETLMMMHEAKVAQFVAYLGLHLVGGIALVAVGFALGRG